MFKTIILYLNIFIIFFRNTNKKLFFTLIMFLFMFVYLFLTFVNFHYFIQNNYIYKFNNFNFDYFGVILVMLSIYISSLCFFFFDLKFFKKSTLFYFFLVFNLFIFLLTTTQNFVLFFLFYELLLLLSAYYVFVSSPNLRSKNVTFYFILWTQLGSFVIFICVLLMINKMQNYHFNNFYYVNFNKNEIYLLKFLLFIGFGIKIPTWPFHFWLTKTHVEANTGFSIFLSGILVKSAIYGIYKFLFFFNTYNNYFFIFLSFISILDASLKIAGQNDLKKIVAYCTILEMNIILINLFFMSKSSYIFVIMFSILHSLLSGLFFFIVDSIYKRYNTRSLTAINNISNYYPSLFFNIILSVLLFNGLPFLLKFNLEIIFIQKLYNYNFIYLILFLIIQFFFIIFFTKHFFSICFGFKKIKYFGDLSYKEIFIFCNFYTIITIMSLI